MKTFFIHKFKNITQQVEHLLMEGKEKSHIGEAGSHKHLACCKARFVPDEFKLETIRQDQTPWECLAALIKNQTS